MEWRMFQEDFANPMPEPAVAGVRIDEREAVPASILPRPRPGRGTPGSPPSTSRPRFAGPVGPGRPSIHARASPTRLSPESGAAHSGARAIGQIHTNETRCRHASPRAARRRWNRQSGGDLGRVAVSRASAGEQHGIDDARPPAVGNHRPKPTFESGPQP